MKKIEHGIKMCGICKKNLKNVVFGDTWLGLGVGLGLGLGIWGEKSVKKDLYTQAQKMPARPTCSLLGLLSWYPFRVPTSVYI